MTGVATDLEDIWLNAIEKHLNIQKKDLSRFKVSMCVILGFKVRVKFGSDFLQSVYFSSHSNFRQC